MRERGLRLGNDVRLALGALVFPGRTKRSAKAAPPPAPTAGLPLDPVASVIALGGLEGGERGRLVRKGRLPGVPAPMAEPSTLSR